MLEEYAIHNGMCVSNVRPQNRTISGMDMVYKNKGGTDAQVMPVVDPKTPPLGWCVDGSMVTPLMIKSMLGED